MIDIFDKLTLMLKEFDKEIIKVLDRDIPTVIIDSPMHFWDVERQSEDGTVWRGFECITHKIIWRVS